jgi:hypothetical protein
MRSIFGAPGGWEIARSLARVMTSMTRKGGTAAPIPIFSKAELLFLKKKKQKNFCSSDRGGEATGDPD